jgi:hypothetical protein
MLDNSMEIEWGGAWEPKVPKGLYSNRRVKFKGAKSERTKDERKKETGARLEDMDERVEKRQEVSSYD